MHDLVNKEDKLIYNSSKKKVIFNKIKNVQFIWFYEGKHYKHELSEI